MPSAIQHPSASWIRDLVDSSKRPHPYSRRDSSPKSVSRKGSFAGNTSSPHVAIHRGSFSNTSDDGDMDVSQDSFSTFKVSLRHTEAPAANPTWAYYGMDRKDSSAGGPLGSLATVCDALSPLEARSGSISSASDQEQDYFGDVNNLPAYSDGNVTPTTEDGHSGDRRSNDSESHSPDADTKKGRRGRILMDPLQSKHLFALWETTYFPTTNEREELAKVSGLSARQVQVWFQNQRQKQRRVLHDPLATEDDKAKLGDLRHSPRTRRRLTLQAEGLGQAPPQSPTKDLGRRGSGLGLDTRTHFEPSSNRSTSPYPFAFRARSSIHGILSSSGESESSIQHQPRPRYPGRVHSIPNVPSLESSAEQRNSLCVNLNDDRRVVSQGDMRKGFGVNDFHLLVAGRPREMVYTSIRDAPFAADVKIELPAISASHLSATVDPLDRRSSMPNIQISHDEPSPPRSQVRLPSFSEMFGGL